MSEEKKAWVAYIGQVTGEEAEFYEALLAEGMESGSYAIAAAMRGFRRWRPKLDRLQRENTELKAADRDHLTARNGMETRLNADIDRLVGENRRLRELPEEPGPRYTAGEYSRRNHEAMIADALGLPRSP